VTQIKKPLQNAPRDVDTNNKLQALLKAKERGKQQEQITGDIVDTQRLITEGLKYSGLYCTWHWPFA
jgi:hypothetical protein